MELTQLIQRAQGALDRGEHHVVAAACRHALATYPTCLGAHRLLGEACLEQGQTAEAIEEFGVTLALDPLDVVSSLGLGVAAEEQGDARSAHAHYLSAWELNPSLDQLRDELVRLQQGLGGDERLHRTRAGLAGVFTRTGQLGRAVAEWRAVFAADPESFRVRTALLDALWRLGDDTAALGLAREILARDPETVRALAILADVEHRRGLPEATATAAKYRALDPAGEVLTQLREAKPHANLTWLMPEPAMVPPFDFETVALPASTPTATPLSVEAPLAAPAMAATLAATEPSQHVAAPDLWDSLVRDISGEGEGGLGGDLAPFAWPAEADGGQVFGLDAGLGGAVPFDASSFAGEAEPADPLAALLVADPVEAPPPPVPSVAPAPPTEPPKAAPAGPAQFITADGRVDLTVGWDDLDRTLQEATPSGETGEFADLIAEFGVDGIAPFDPLSGEADESWEPFSEQDFAEWTESEGDDGLIAAAETGPVGAAAVADDLIWPDDAVPTPPSIAQPVAAQPPVADSPYSGMDTVTALTEGWDAIEDELAAAVPQAGGPDDEGFDSLNDEGIVPFDFTGAADAVDPLANPDAVGEPLDFDDLLMVTSQDGTAPLGGGPVPVTAEPERGDAWQASGEIADTTDPFAADANRDPLAGLEPFAFDDAGVAGPAESAVDFSDVDDESRPAFGAVVEGFDLFDDAEAALPTDDESLTGSVAVPASWAAELDVAGSDQPVPVEFDAVDELPFAAQAPSPALAPPLSAAPSTRPGEPSLWPAFVSGTSELVDRYGELGILFARLREEKESLVGLGMVIVDRSISRQHPAAVSHETSRPAGDIAPTAQPRTGPFEVVGDLGNGHGPNGANGTPTDDRIVALPALVATGEGDAARPDRARQAVADPELATEVAQWRGRLREGRNEAAEVVAVLERRLADGGQEPALLRVLGEAYLRLGRSDLAAAQFRAASARRVRRA